jgi:hypothetical protein
MTASLRSEALVAGKQRRVECFREGDVYGRWG